MMLLWALLYYVLPDVEQDFKFITPGSVGGVIVWVIASWAFSFYVSHFGSYDRTYGSIAGVIILLFWMWISALVMLLGAEVNSVIEHRSPEGKREGAKSLADTGTTPAALEGGGGPMTRAARRAGQRRGGGWDGQERRLPPRRATDGKGGAAGVAAVVAGFATGFLLFRKARA
ncbi:MAG: YihY/virulence factor BrkB family protein [Anaeromyxobacter sp.]